MNKSFPKSLRIRKKSEFLELFQNRKRKSGTFLFIDYRPSSSKRLGLTVPARFGKAHERNRFKRLVREAFRLLEIPPYEINVHPQAIAKAATHKDIEQDLKNLL